MIEKILSTAKSQIGYRENPAGSNRTKFGRWYGMDGNPWCAMFTSWVYAEAGFPLPKMQDGAPSGAAYCPYIEGYARRIGQWHKTPRPGDLALFHFGNRLAVHIGIVENISGAKFSSIEGNTSAASNANGGMVQRRSRNVSQCRGFYRPMDIQARTGKDAYYRLIRLRRPYMAGHDVREWQKQVNFWGISIEIDGIYGPESEKVCRTLQEKWGLEVDGVIGPITWERTFKPSREV
ncbi:MULTISPECIES: peptidoglycan-binding protein [Cyanophyceae]|nr:MULTISPECIES: peptidoglycan-binding domain-containing protein [unclassified Picosynechococcus]SMH55139.1 Putative peptidoglycan binding domain-containing protein [Picosynechococcus sp. OG1]SMQ83163.1 Putative peptidoglycan binding domain-containing protein [Synechococcus sp. 7002]